MNMTRHGGPWDRGSADAYYNRPFQPHYFKGDTYNSEKVERKYMSEEEIAAYTDGYGKGLPADPHVQDEIKEWE